jgi:hypothetical protein
VTVRIVSVTFGSFERMIESESRRPSPAGWDFSTLITSTEGDPDEAATLALIHDVSETQARLEAVRMRMLHRYSRLHGDERTAPNELACVEHVSTSKARTDLALANALATRLPETATALATGLLNYDQMSRIARATAVLSPEDAGAVDAMAFPLALEKTPRQLGQFLRGLIATVDPHGGADRARKRRATRRVTAEHDQDEMSWLHAYLSSEDVLAIDERLELIARSVKNAGGEERSIGQLRADAMRDLLLGKFSSKVVTHVYVACNATTLLGLDDLPGTLRGYGPISAEKVRELGFRLKALWSGVLVDEKGYARRLATKKYKPSALLTEFVQLRDQTCTFPVCMKPAQLSDIDHLVPFDQGGATDQHNCGPRCRCHHLAKQSGLWEVTRGVDGEDIWLSTVTGNSYVNRPEPLIPEVALKVAS